MTAARRIWSPRCLFSPSHVCSDSCENSITKEKVLAKCSGKSPFSKYLGFQSDGLEFSKCKILHVGRIYGTIWWKKLRNREVIIAHGNERFTIDNFFIFWLGLRTKSLDKKLSRPLLQPEVRAVQVAILIYATYSRSSHACHLIILQLSTGSRRRDAAHFAQGWFACLKCGTQTSTSTRT